MNKQVQKYMENQVSQRIASLSASSTLAMLAKTQELKAQGIDIISLSVGEPDFNTPDNVKEAAKAAIDANYSRYSPVPGFMPLRKAIVEKLKRENGLEYTAEQIVVTNGGKQAVAEALMTIVNPGDEVIIPTPYWVSYPEMVKLADGTNVFVETGLDRHFKLTPEQLRAAITPKTRALILCSPSNPTGAVYSREEIEALVKVLLDYPQVIVLSDEIYEHINYVGKHVSMAEYPEMKERVVVLNGCSKGYAMTGWRLGWLAAPLWLAKGAGKLQGQFTSGPCSITQMAAIEAYEGDQQSVRMMKEAFEHRRDVVYELTNATPGFRAERPEGAFYIFPECSAWFGKKTAEGEEIKNADDLAMYLLMEAHVASVSGVGFGAPNYIRFSYANSEENIREAFRRINAALAKLS